MKEIKVKERVIDFSDFSKGVDYDTLNNRNTGTAIDGYNFKFDSGTLSTGLGTAPLVIKSKDYMPNTKTITASDMRKIFAYTPSATTEPKIVMISEDGKVYTDRMESLTPTYTELYDFEEYPNWIRYSYDSVNYLLFSTDTKFYVYSGGVFTTQITENPVNIYDVCAHNGMLFVVKNQPYKYVINYCTDLNPANIQTNFGNMRSITLPDTCGNIVKLVSFNDYLYIFCEYGIYRLVSYESKKKLYIEPVYYGTTNIFRESIVMAGSRIVFTARDGIYTFTGLKVNKLKLNIDKILKPTNSPNAVAIYSDGIYYVACNLTFNDSKIIGAEFAAPLLNNSVLMVDLEKESVVINRGLALSDMEVFRNYSNKKLACVTSSYLGTEIFQLEENGVYRGSEYYLDKHWQTCYYDLDMPNTMKICKKVTITTATDITVTVNCDDNTFAYSLKGSAKPQTIYVNEKGYKFGLTFDCVKCTAKISDVKMVVGVYE